jgi:hypothetical protein
MDDFVNDLMHQATRLTRQGRLLEATGFMEDAQRLERFQARCHYRVYTSRLTNW